MSQSNLNKKMSKEVAFCSCVMVEGNGKVGARRNKDQKGEDEQIKDKCKYLAGDRMQG